MLNSNTAALTAERELLQMKIAGRTLNACGVALLSCAMALFACLQFSVVQRTGIGMLAAASMILSGDLLSRRGSQGWSFGTSLAACGYALAAFFAHATYYVPGVSALASPQFSWLAEILVAAIATVQTSRNSFLRWLSLPFTLLVSSHVLGAALTSSETLSIAGFTITVSAIASVCGMLWLAGLSALYKELELRLPHDDTAGGAQWLLYRVANELFFVLAALNALALPNFLSSAEYAPLWWSLETPVLLAICWRSKSFVKHSLVMGIWAVSAVLLLMNKMELSPLVCMALPLSGLVMALAYRCLESSWARWQKLTGYAVYLYGSVAVALLVPFLQLGAWQGLPYFLAESGLLLGLSLSLRDRLLQKVSTGAAAASLAVFALHYQEWTMPLLATVSGACYIVSLIYGHIRNLGGMEQSEFTLLPGQKLLSVQEARYLELASGVAGYLALMSGSFLLLPNPFNTMAWGAEAFMLIAFGFLTSKVGHRFSGLVAMGVASAKLTIFDLSGSGTLLRTLVSFGAVGVCCVAASIFYLVEYGRKHKSQDKEREIQDKN